jgi:hypothetical protein
MTEEMPMAMIDDIHQKVQELQEYLVTGPAPIDTKLNWAGLVPRTYHEVVITYDEVVNLTGGVADLAARVGGIEKQVVDTGSLLNAVNEQTLGRIEMALTDGFPRLDYKLAQVQDAITLI